MEGWKGALPAFHPSTLPLIKECKVISETCRQNGVAFILATVDDFESEVESLRYNDAFIAFLDARAKEPKIPIEEARKQLLEHD